MSNSRTIPELKALFWDMDGTLVNSEPKWGEATYAMSEAMGRRITPEIRELTVGGSENNAIYRCAEYAGILEGLDYEYWRQWLRQKVGSFIDQGLEFMPGVPDLLEEGKNSSLSMALVTNTTRGLLDRSLRSIGAHYFDMTIAGDEVSVGKPNPEIYEKAAHSMGLDPQNILVIEDSTTGMTAARNAGCVVLGLATEGTQIPEGVRTITDLDPQARHLEGVDIKKLHEFWFQLQYEM